VLLQTTPKRKMMSPPLWNVKNTVI
jgi:hypothetical protein